VKVPFDSKVPEAAPDTQIPAAYLLMAAAQMEKMNRLAGDVIDFHSGRPITPAQAAFTQVPFGVNPGEGGYDNPRNINEVAKGVMQGKVKVLKPGGN
jgi:hypothetical protein